MKTALGWANSMHETDLYHWSAPSFERYWTQRLGMTLLRGRGDVGLAAAARAQLPQRVVLLEAVGVDLAPSVHERVKLALELGIVQLPLQHGGPIAGLAGRWLPSSLS